MKNPAGLNIIIRWAGLAYKLDAQIIPFVDIGLIKELGKWIRNFKGMANPLTAFKGITSRGLENSFSLRDIAIFGELNDSTGVWYGFRILTVKDIYRYIMNVPEDYNESSVLAAYNKLYKEWAPQEGESQVRKESGILIRNIIDKAKAGLLSDLEDSQ